MEEKNITREDGQMPVPQTPSPATSESVVYSRRKIYFLIAGIGILLSTGAVFGYFQYQKVQNNNYISKEKKSVVVSHDLFKFPDPAPYNSSSSTPENFHSLTPGQNLFNCTSTTFSTKKVNGEISWQKPSLVASSTIFSSGNPFIGQPDYYKLGHFESGGYAGADLYLVDEPCDGMCVSDTFYYLVKKDNQIALIQKNSSWQFSGNGTGVPGIGVDNNYDIADLVYPTSILGPSGQNLQLDSKAQHQPFCASNFVKTFTNDALGDVYIDKTTSSTDYIGKNGFYLQAPDGTLRAYKIVIDFIGADNVPLITWNNNVKNQKEYTYTDRTGCGSYNYDSVVSADKVNVERDLIQTGVTINGQPIYEFKNINNSILKDFYDNNYYPGNGQDKQPYKKFTEGHPVFFWKDSFGRLIKFTRTDYLSMAECGKPVIYLYPQKTENINVKLNPVGGFTYSEPAYNSGWNVISDPKSNITNLADGKNYPYLFWEGRGGLYQMPEKGFVIKHADVHEFLHLKLHELGLNQKESADFMEFWEPKMQSAPYYFITFMGNSVMDELAPLSVSPKPDTVIRILMDFKPLEKPINVEGFNIRTPERKGFTVVEWGGVLRNFSK